MSEQETPAAYADLLFNLLGTPGATWDVQAMGAMISEKHGPIFREAVLEQVALKSDSLGARLKELWDQPGGDVFSNFVR